MPSLPPVPGLIHWLRPVAVSLLAAAAAAFAAAQSRGYAVVELATLDPGTSVVVRGPNQAGTAFGGGRLSGATGRPRDGLVFERGAVQPVVGLAGSDNTNVLGANDAGAFVGAANGGGTLRGFAGQRGGASRELPPLAGDTASAAYAVNNAGLAVGWSSGPGGERAVMWSAAGVPIALAVPGGLSSRAYAVNQNGSTAGVMGSAAARRAALWRLEAAAMELAPFPGMSASEAMAINARGDVVGYSASAAEVRRATLWPATGGPAVDLGTLPGGTASQAFGLNDAGAAVGSCESPQGLRACLWSGGAAQDLNTLAQASQLVLSKAVGITNAGVILALGHVAEGDGHAHDHERAVRVVLLVPGGAQ